MELLQEIKEKIDNFHISDYYFYLNKIKKEIDISSLKKVKIAVLRSYTAEMLEPFLRVLLLLEGYDLEIRFGGFNQYPQEILDLQSWLYKFEPDFVILMTRIEDILPDFIDNFDLINEADWEQKLAAKSKEFANLFDLAGKNLNTNIIVQNTFLNKAFWGIYDSQMKSSQHNLIHKYNQKLAEIAQERPFTFIWNFAGFLSREGYDNIFDPKIWYLSRNPFSKSAYMKMAKELKSYIMSILGKVKKCIVLDLDNTLWGGIAGEDGLEGIQLGYDYPGNCYLQFQKELLKLNKRGIVLAINSKNNENDALNIIENHPYMVLKKENFATMQINWTDKATNLHKIINTLNIGADSVIFIDDNPVECELVKENFPQCCVIKIPDKPFLIPEIINKLPDIETIKLTNEDKNKSQMYQAQSQRKNLEVSAVSLEDFLYKLEMKVQIEPMSNFSLPRIAQLTQKTNQFNTTLKRYTDKDILDISQDCQNFIFSVACTDKFGDNGIIGVIILKTQNKTCFIDTFLLSCRVIGRTIEESMIAFIVKLAQKKCMENIIGKITRHSRNKMVHDIYSKFNFTKITDDEFSIDIKDYQIEYSPFTKVVHDGVIT